MNIPLTPLKLLIGAVIIIIAAAGIFILGRRTVTKSEIIIPSPTITSTPTPMVQIRGQNFEIRGTVTSVSGNSFVAGGRTITIDPSQVVNFQQKITPAVGVAVKVEGIVKNNILFAREIQPLDDNNRDGGPGRR